MGRNRNHASRLFRRTSDFVAMAGNAPSAARFRKRSNVTARSVFGGMFAQL